MKYLSLKEIQTAEKELLEKFSTFCEANDIKYFVYGGTLLGTIRHKGFIPWDDDIDIIMPRPDYRKFIERIHKKSLGKNIRVSIPGLEKKTLFPFIKIYNETIGLESINGIDRKLWIDIFPVDGIKIPPLKELKKTVFLRRIYTAKRRQAMRVDDSNLSHLIIALKWIRRIPLYLIPLNFYAKVFINYCQKQEYESSEYVCDTVWAKHQGNILKKEWLEETIKMPFEDMEVNVFGGYKHYLENRYGKDYMKIPPKDKRQTHHIKAYRIDK